MYASLLWMLRLFSGMVRAQRELHSPWKTVPRNKAKDHSGCLPPSPSKCSANVEKEKFSFFLKEKGNESQREHKMSPKWKGH